MEMLQLRYFYESAKSESFSHTAKKYMVPVSSVSASVKRLETEMGVELFSRTGNRILLTEKGKQFLSVVSNALGQLDNGVTAVTADPSQGGTLHILVRATRQMVMRRALRFHRSYPSVVFKLTLPDEQENYDDYDLIVSVADETLEGYESVELHRTMAHILAHESDPLCQRTVTLSQLRDRLFVTTNPQLGAFRIFAKACEKQGFTPKVWLECDDYTCWDMAVLSGECLGVTMGNATQTSMPNAQYLAVSDFNEQVVSNVYYKKEKYEGNVKLFVDFIKNAAWKE